MVRHSGIGRYLRNLFPLLLPLLEADKIRILASRETLGSPAWLADPRIELFETTAAIYTIAEQLFSLRGAYRDTDLLWVPHFNAPLRYPGKMVVTIHDIAPLAMPQILGNALKRAYAKLLIERSVHQASAILSVSQFTRDELISRLAVPPAKITVTPAGLDLDWPQSAPPHTEPDATPYFLYVGNVKPNKNLSTLLQAFTTVLDRIPHRLILAGKIKGFGTNDDAVIHQAEALGPRVRFTGEVTDAELQQLYAGASALVLPSLYEGFGLPILEAMSLNCPVLASTAGSLPEVGGDAALYFDPHSAAQLANRLLELADTAAMQILRTLGQARVQQFSFQHCAEQSAAVLNRILSQPQEPQ
jgi:glycosyltransferase involved in cell wall biosynthesis